MAPRRLKVQPLTSEWALTHNTAGAAEGREEGGMSYTSTTFPSGIEFLSTSIIHEPSEITLVGRMDEVYFCMVLHKDEDRRHFLLYVLLF